MTNLSSAAQAVLAAYHQEAIDYIESWGSFEHRRGIAAVLRAAADEVAPMGYEDIWTDGRILQYEKQDPVRDKLLAISDELEGVKYGTYRCNLEEKWMKKPINHNVLTGYVIRVGNYTVGGTRGITVAH